MKTGGELLADFLGWEVSKWARKLKRRKMSPDEIPWGYFKIHPSDLQFEKSWALLMKVVERIESVDIKGEVIIGADKTNIEIKIGNTTKHFNFMGKGKLDNTYFTVVHFVTWYLRGGKKEIVSHESNNVVEYRDIHPLK